MAHANHHRVSIAAGQIAGATADRDATRDWESVRASADTQFAPFPPFDPPKPPQTPGWLEWLGRMMEAIFEPIFGPIGRFLGMSWPVFQWVLYAAGGVLLLLILWRMAEPFITSWRTRVPVEDAVPEWTPSRREALALLEDADRLAAEGRYGEAAHLLLRRSVRQISDARPDWLIPASTAREIAALPLLPESGRTAFGVIATRVERAIFALRDLDSADWDAARGAYARFAAVDLRA